MGIYGAAEKLDILLAEDDAEIAAMHKMALVSAGHDVEVAPDGDAALQAVHEKGPDLVVLDLEMPKRDGFEVLEGLRSAPATVEQPVVVLSNKELSRREEEKLEELGALDFLPKWNVTPNVLVGWIRGWAAAMSRKLKLGKRIP